MLPLSLLFFSCITSGDSTKKVAPNAPPATAESPKQDTTDARPSTAGKTRSFAPPASCTAKELSQGCSKWLVETLQAFAEPPHPENGKTSHPLETYNIRAAPLSIEQNGPAIYAFTGALDTTAKMISALQNLVSQPTVQKILDTRLREYNGKVVTAYSDCDETSVIPHDGKWYLGPEGDDTGLDLTNPVPFVKNGKGSWVLDADISFGCWALPTLSDPKLADQLRKITFTP